MESYISIYSMATMVCMFGKASISLFISFVPTCSIMTFGCFRIVRFTESFISSLVETG